jgi:dTDP-4-amino-4,6-dideoxygalactose transaminase
MSKMGRVFGGRPGDCPVTERVAERLLRLPFYTNMTDDEQNTVIRSAPRLAIDAVQSVRRL